MQEQKTIENYFPQVISKGKPVRICPQIRVEVDQSISEAARHSSCNCEFCRSFRSELRTEMEMKSE